MPLSSCEIICDTTTLCWRAGDNIGLLATTPSEYGCEGKEVMLVTLSLEADICLKTTVIEFPSDAGLLIAVFSMWSIGTIFKSILSTPKIPDIKNVMGDSATRLSTRLPLLGSRVRVSVTPFRFHDGRNGVSVGFLGVSPFSTATNLIPPFLHTYLIHFVSFHLPLWWYPCYYTDQ